MAARRWVEAAVAAQAGTGLLLAPIALAAGIVAYFALRFEPSIWMAVPPGVLGCVLIALRVLRGQGTLLALIGLVGIGFAAAWIETRTVAAPVLQKDFFGAVTGRLIGTDRSQSNRLRLLLDTVHLQSVAPEQTPHRVRVVVNGALTPGTTTPGATIMLRARLGPPPQPVEPGAFDFRRHAWFLRLGAIGYSGDPVMLAAPLEPDRGLMLYRIRHALAEAIRARMPPRSGGFAAAILTGDRSGIDPEDLVDLRASNLAHLLAISGLHMGILTGVVFMFVRLGLCMVPGAALRLPVKKIAALSGLAIGLAYLGVSGASVATQRAFVMAAVIFGAILIDRPALTLRGVAVAALIVMLIRPVSVVGAGFQMSFAATTALILCYSTVQRWRPWRTLGQGRWRFVQGFLALVLTSSVAGLATAPFSAFHFNQVSQFGLIANVLAVPAMGMVVMPAALTSLVLTPFGAEWLAFAAMQIGIDHILRVATWVADMDGTLRPVPAAPALVLGLIAFGLALAAAVKGPSRGLAAVPALIGAIIWCVTPRPDVLISPDGRLVGVLTGEGRVLSARRGSGFAAEVWLAHDADPVPQSVAAARPHASPGFKVTLPGGAGQVWLTDAPGTCTPSDLVIAPKLEGTAIAACLTIGAEALRQGGAHAFWVKDGTLGPPRTTANLTGSRPWAEKNLDPNQPAPDR